MTDVVERLKRDFQDPDYRHIYDEGFLNSSLATQLKVLREERQWTQERLATEAKMNQSRVSEMEDVNFNSWTIRTLRKFTRAFDLRLKISFEEFGTLLDDFPKLNRGALSRHSFKEDAAFKEPAGKEPKPEEAFATADRKSELEKHSGLMTTQVGLVKAQTGLGLSNPLDQSFTAALARIQQLQLEHIAPYLARGNASLWAGLGAESKKIEIMPQRAITGSGHTARKGAAKTVNQAKRSRPKRNFKKRLVIVRPAA